MNSWLVGLLDSWVAWVVIKWTQNTAQLKKEWDFHLETLIKMFCMIALCLTEAPRTFFGNLISG